MAAETSSRELTPMDVAVLEPDLLGVVAMALYGRAAPSARPPEPRAFAPRERSRTPPPRA